MNDEPTTQAEIGTRPWPQRLLDNLWLLLALSIIVPGVLYLGWGLWELAELPTWSGG